MLIAPEETKLIGRWQYANGAIQADIVAERIDALTNSYLTELAVSDTGSQDGRFRVTICVRPHNPKVVAGGLPAQ